MEGLNDLETAVLEKLLAGDHPILGVLRIQRDMSRLKSREFTGVGFYCFFEVPPQVPTVEGQMDFEIEDVSADLNDLTRGAGFVLFIRKGRLDNLEGFSYDEPWPEQIRTFRLTYTKEPREFSIGLGGRD